MARTVAAHSLVSLDQLESRVVLAATEVAAVGLSFHQREIAGDRLAPPTYATYALLGHVNENDTLRYRLRRDGANGPAAPTELREAALRLREDGTFDYENDRWRGTGLEYGSWFMPGDGFSMGWWRARQDEWPAWRDSSYVEHSEQQLIVPLAESSTPLREVAGTWRVTLLERDIAGRRMNVYTGTLGITIEDRRVLIIDEASGDTIVDATINSGTGGSRFTTTSGQQFYLSADGSTLVFVDLVSGDGAIHIGAAVRAAPEVIERDVVGSYRLIGLSPSYSGVRPADVALALNADGTYEAGGQTLIVPTGSAGTWFVQGGTEIVLRPRAGGSELRFMLSDTRGTLLLVSSSFRDDVFAIGNRAVDARSPSLGYASVGAEGQGLVFIEREEGQWNVVDVAAESGGPSVTGKMVTWFEERTGLARAAAVTARGLTVYSERGSGAWTFDVLAESLGTGTMVRPEIATMIGPGGGRNIFAIDINGDIIRYVLSSEREASWREWNFSENQLHSQGLSTPDFVGPIVATTTLWRGVNIAGIDSSERLITVWTSPGAGRWHIADLSAVTGMGPLSSGLDLVAAGRHGMYFSVIDTSGTLTLVSWKPWTGTWIASPYISSPLMQSDEVSMVFDGSRRALFITSLAADTGELLIHLVPLAFTDLDPYMATISGPGAPPEQQVREGLDVVFLGDWIIRVFGINQDDETVQFRANDPLYDEWAFENLTEIAT